MGDAGEKVLDNDAEGVWSPDIEQSFQEALAIYPPCGRRKIILSDEGKMYGRNELIARYIKLRTGKIRTRKQVSSHIQVLARRKTREIQTKFKDQVAKDKALQSMAAMSSAQLVSATVLQEKLGLSEPNYPSSTTTQPTDLFHFWAGDVNQGQTTPDIEANLQAPYSITPIAASTAAPGYPTTPGMDSCLPSTTTSWPRSHIGTETLRLVEFTAFMEWQNELAMFKEQHRFVHIDPTPMCEPPLEMVDIRQIYDKFPEEGGGLRDLYDQGPPHAFFLVKFWADLSFSLLGEEPGGSGGAFYGVSSRYEGPRALTLNCTSKVCSFGKQVVEKLETAEPAHWEDGRYVFRMQRSALCEYLINFIRKLRTLPEKQMMDSVLENFTILQILRDQETQELLLCVAFVFEVSASELGAQHHIYRLGRD
ncbi:PREDICTED: transcriptional enhancer factor TEF-4 isoform X1 [Thamnophis sirtalis]|uniref:Transcriptional enhancer factor TEF-4 isoform X1 n=1 Tax=Thamnophis sirtalis TaxID=35019 RepID=A0A6I9XC75_9SAUR|nr:PREDICTED: transcriptional enhancer factor TEF-4 isoform X1 [Thamnophis sirtalis]XP_013908773.1 PREDICTED: transcriptional enhancer factor TEF-4 isoform X1 [Thamnophis sirtalis]XP_013908774.1 PREDICTED: transcriptional enhancer factor TEF-4 isoform X1 [Thamnophis sirtalis]XP_013908775.1 PREDICTED: transcriptional enhancer factor TEF-4 isoform X1 [Thamnophis sirtalis]XP_013908776.1 PREDICTED: transcriptional enhancer factor TEF-4 isoform X1 [Thamnophis sirtalis]XP_032091260.1 transcriptional